MMADNVENIVVGVVADTSDATPMIQTLGKEFSSLQSKIVKANV